MPRGSAAAAAPPLRLFRLCRLAGRPPCCALLSGPWGCAQMGRAPATPSIFIKSMSTLYDSEPPWSEAPDPLPWSGRLAAGQAHGRENWPKAYLGITLPRRLRRRRHRLQSTYGPGDHKGHMPGTHTHHMAKKSVTLLYLAGVTALRPTLGMLGLPRPCQAQPVEGLTLWYLFLLGSPRWKRPANHASLRAGRVRH